MGNVFAKTGTPCVHILVCHNDTGLPRPFYELQNFRLLLQLVADAYIEFGRQLFDRQIDMSDYDVFYLDDDGTRIRIDIPKDFLYWLVNKKQGKGDTADLPLVLHISRRVEIEDHDVEID